MMKKIILYLICLLQLAHSGCKKTIPKQESIPQLEKITQTMFNGNPYNATQEFIYEEDGKRVKEIKEYRMNNARINKRYSYSDSQVQYRYYLDGTEETREAISYKINNAALIVQQENSHYGSIIVFEYNEFKYLKKVSYNRMGVPEGYSKYYYQSGNVLDSIEFYDNDNTVSYVTIFEYTTGKRNSIADENKGLQLFGRSQVSPLKKETRILKNHPGAIGRRVRFFELEYAYTYDTLGRIRGATTTRTDFSYPGNGSTFYVGGVYEYTYK